MVWTGMGARYLARGRWARTSVGFGLRVRACAGDSADQCAGRGRVAMLAFVWPCLPSCGHACLRVIVLCGLGDWGLGLVWGCVLDVEWMSDVRAVLAACVLSSQATPRARSFAQATFREVWKCRSRAGKTKPSTVHGGRFWWVSTTRVRVLISKGAGRGSCPMGVRAHLDLSLVFPIFQALNPLIRALNPLFRALLRELCSLSQKPPGLRAEGLDRSMRGNA